MNYPEDYIGKVIEGDCLEVMKGMPDKCVDLVLTDPPYGIAYLSNRYKYGNPHTAIANDDKPFYPIDEMWRLVKDGGAMFCFYSHKEQLVDERIRNVIIWVKDNWSAGDLEGDFGNQYEMIAFMPKGNFKLVGGRPSNVWEHPREKPEFHPTQKPINIAKRIIQHASEEGAIVLDPFLGGGTTAIAAEGLNRKWIGIEKEPKYCEIARRRLSQVQSEMFT